MAKFLHVNYFGSYNYLRLYLVVGYLLRFGSLLCVARTFLVELHIDGVLQVLYAGLVVVLYAGDLW